MGKMMGFTTRNSIIVKCLKRKYYDIFVVGIGIITTQFVLGYCWLIVILSIVIEMQLK